MGARSYSIERTIDAPAADVWRLLTDATTYGDWNDAVISIEGPIALGETVELVSVVNPKRTFTLKVTELAPPSGRTTGTMVWADGMPLGLFTGRRTYAVRPVGDDRCEFSMVEAYSGPLAPLITKAIPDMTDSFVQIADGLKAGAER